MLPLVHLKVGRDVVFFLVLFLGPERVVPDRRGRETQSSQFGAALKELVELDEEGHPHRQEPDQQEKAESYVIGCRIEQEPCLKQDEANHGEDAVLRNILLEGPIRFQCENEKIRCVQRDRR